MKAPAYTLLALTCLLGSLAVSCQKSPRSFMSIPLATGWEFRQVGTETWYPAMVPGTVHQDLFTHGLIPDFRYRQQEEEVQWVEKESWEYRTIFQVTPATAEMPYIHLYFEGLDTYAEVFLNDTLVHRAHNMFIGHRIAIKPYLKPGKNTLLVRFASAVEEGMKKLQTIPYILKATNEQALENERTNVFTRKAPFHYGWDWGPRLVTCGIWKPVRLEAWEASRIDAWYLRPVSIMGEVATYQAEVTVDNPSGQQTLVLSLNGLKIGEVALENGKATYTIPFTIQNPQLWWPAGYGEPYLYDARLSLEKDGTVLQESSQPLGVRSVALVQRPDSLGHSFYFEVNGVPVFAKGANYIPNETLTPAITAETYEMVLQAALDANMNMLRVWGGAIYEDDLFYRLCDQKGIMVWQDFMFACALMPPLPDHLEDIRQEAEYQVKRLRKHPSLVLWCGNNENLIAWHHWGWKDAYPKAFADSLWATYEQIFYDILPTAVKNHQPGMAYWASSPSSVGDQLPNRRSGDEHDWTIWFGQKPFSHYASEVPRFVSEYGIQSYAPWESVLGFTEPADRNADSPVMRARQRSKMDWIRPGFDGNDMIAKYVNDYFREPATFQDMVYTSQLMQALALQTAIEAHRSAKPHCMGSLYWQLNDCWPATSWATIDYRGQWKASHYAVQEAFRPLAAFPQLLPGGELAVRVVNDLLRPGKGKAGISVLTLDGLEVAAMEWPYAVGANGQVSLPAVAMQQLTKRQPLGNLVGVLYWQEEEEGEFRRPFYFTEPKNLLLKAPEISLEAVRTTTGYELTVTSGNTLAKGVMLSCSEPGAVFSRNFFDLLPGEPLMVQVRMGKGAKDEAVFSAFSLYQAYQPKPGL